MGASARWRIFCLDELIQSGAVCLGRGKVISKTDLVEIPGTFPVYSSAREGDGKFGEYGKYLFDEELITWSVDGGGRLFHRLKHKFSVTNVGGFLRVVRQDLISYRFLYYALTLEHSRVKFDWVKKAHPSTLRKEYKNIPLPSLSEQKRIVAILDEAFKGIDTAVANAEKNLSNANELFENYLDSAFVRKDANWIERPLGECFRLRSGDSMTSKAMVDGPFPVFGGNGVAGMHSEFNLSGNNVIVGRVGALCGNARYVTERIWLTDNAFKVVGYNQELDGSFLTFLLNHLNLRLLARQSAQPVLSNSSLKDLLLVFPESVLEQRRIAGNIKTLSSETQRLEFVCRQKLSNLIELRQAILRKAFAGELSTQSANAVREATE